MKKDSYLPIIAIIGVDGSGKSTVTAEICEWLKGDYPVRSCHLGRQTGTIGRKIAKLPLLGKKLDKKISGKSHAARAEQGPKAGVALVIFLLSLRRVYRFYKMLRLKKQGFLIVTDRYPQTSVIGGLDGPDLTVDYPKSLIARFLTRCERRLYNWMVSHKPDLVIRLNVDLETAMQRKPDHRLHSMERKIATFDQITFNGAPIVDLYSHKQPLVEMIQEAKKRIASILPQKISN
ncbi:nucleoside triphosphate hydrolase [Commensalibacter papalotli (ex Botero et al. 2024)]|uniref:Thymidylate kinase (Tmk) (PDB:3LV8) n=1 Tax=Commensalibacter papalotli (ex Botero et al. 2024) TaxID=2972766 RepID=A0ABM9HM26_9PROT|nr:nucleoside triphosphate hydrolase [Commensalibacter papalotli (ex Botero et al. 2024)]CAI3935841.1 Thymidylate kinase (Tmk) (PDB:3LV8) [Commensalibacter papalotli (ex Botero et al. 2024)]CAI3952003.1 Thymidylate kinase (Tmk) (PDB:3LV8) [Commensalibacter papalotli (ex Botero et al. 2024)]